MNMKRIELTDVQREKIMDALAVTRDENGSFEVDAYLDEMTVNAYGWMDVETYVEDDYRCGYMRGTGAAVTYRRASIDLTAYDQDGNKYAVDEKSCRIIDRYMNEAS